MKRDNMFDGSTRNYLMRNNGFYVGFNMPEALSGEATFGLPPYAKRMSYLVDKYPACPKDWLRSEGIVKSFFIPVVEGKGMWLDFNENLNHTHHVAIVISVQGINPITGLPCKDAQLEQYIEECPKHKIKFGPDRYCSKCDYKWPKQNYVCTTGTPDGIFWLDGFRTIEGVVRQYILTAEKMKGVASNIIGKDRVYAIGLSFFISKEKKSPRATPGGIIYRQPQWFSPLHTPINWQIPPDPAPWYNPSGLDSYTTCNTKMPGNSQPINTSYSCLSSDSCLSIDSLTPPENLVKEGLFKQPDLNSSSSASDLENDSRRMKKSASVHMVQTQKLEIGAGAKINQAVYDDPEKLEYWHDKPESIICVNYVTEKDALKILEKGEIDIEGQEEGFLKEVPVGN